jgi:hypothetical protein
LICISFLKPLSQPDLRNLPLLLGCFVKFSFWVIVETSPKNLQYLQHRLPRSAHDENTPEASFVLAIGVRQSLLRRSVCVGYLPLFLR